MAFSLTLNITTLAAGYVYPLYATYKALSASSRASSTVNQYNWYTAKPKSNNADANDKPTELAELEALCMYWAVMGTVRIAEAWAEWTWRWIPFYAYTKLVLILWLVLPQTRGATILYTRYMEPFIASHEQDIDLFVDRATARFLSAASKTLSVLYHMIRGELGEWASQPSNIPSRHNQTVYDDPPTQSRPLPNRARASRHSSNAEQPQESGSHDGVWSQAGEMLHAGVPYLAASGASTLHWLSENALHAEQVTQQAAEKKNAQIHQRTREAQKTKPTKK
ncbi:hypothetical protein MPSI1_003434 [Malassezia psittaci]|uniref:Protein YOP1 n=1 Tax=Malassezia psittaci TaxID=1821823 RepID=A0AAF0F8S7_9BASI|nr:hypothetical protein MPSI1_003434 [Malassezia psittaci]